MITEFVRPAAIAVRMSCMFQRYLNSGTNLTQVFSTLIKTSITQTFIHKIPHQGTRLETWAALCIDNTQSQQISFMWEWSRQVFQSCRKMMEIMSITFIMITSLAKMASRMNCYTTIIASLAQHRQQIWTQVSDHKLERIIKWTII
jgi:hypothetical protein